jgi:hypothetical protein
LHRAVILVAALTIAAGSSSAAAKGTGRTENLYDPQHFESLPPEIRSVIAGLCSGGEPRAMHIFAEYSQGEQIITLHYERLYCVGRDVDFCKPNGCLHQVFRLSGGHYRLERSYYGPN